MNTYPGTSCLLTSDDLTIPTRPSRDAGRRTRVTVATDPGDDTLRAHRAALVGRRAEICCACGVSLGETFTRRSKSGKTFCGTCADRAVAAYYARHPEARPATTPCPGRERTGTAYLRERERYVARYHAGHARWLIDDTQARRWTSARYSTQAEAETAATRMNGLWRAQVAHENRKGEE